MGRLPVALDKRDVAPLLKVSERTAQRLLAKGALGPVSRIGGRLRVLREDLLDALRGRSRR
ncbi:MAG: helix-turn-helix domain-containing protein [Planctomycetota bacterium]